MENKQSAEKELAIQKEIASIIFDRNWSILNKNSDELLLSIIQEDMIIESHIEYSNLKNQELQKQVEELKEQYIKYYEEHQGNIKTLEDLYKETINENITLQSDYTKLKEAADEMYDYVDISYQKGMRSFINYKQLTTKP